jgi:hypothetical protein
MGAETGRRQGYAADILPQGAMYGDLMDVAAFAYDASLPPASTAAPYADAGDEPIVG